MSHTPVAFLSYAHIDNDHDDNRVVSLFGDLLMKEVSVQTGGDFQIFHDRKDIQWGQNWRSRIDTSLNNEVTFFIPIITPNFFNSDECRRELEIFLPREEELQRSDLILPVYYIDYPPFNDSKGSDDELVKAIAAHQYVDWRDFRFKSVNSEEVLVRLASIATQLRNALARTPTIPAPPAPSSTSRTGPARSTKAVKSVELAPQIESRKSGTKKKTGRAESTSRRQRSESSPSQSLSPAEEHEKLENLEASLPPETQSPELQTESTLTAQHPSLLPPEGSTNGNNLESQDAKPIINFPPQSAADSGGPAAGFPKAGKSIIIFTPKLWRLFKLTTSLFITILLLAWFVLGYIATILPTLQPPPAPLSLVSFEFETALLNSQGAEYSRRNLQAKYFTENLDGVSLDMVKVPGGEFRMGSPDNEALRGIDEGPRHSVKAPEFFMGRYEITREQWRQVARMPRVKIDLQEDPSHFKDSPRQPVEQVSWREAVEFCERLKKKTGRAYRLPTEAEWEYAARARTPTPFAFGPTVTPQMVNYNSSYPIGSTPEGDYRAKTVEVGSLRRANDFGLFDMHGNVWEWCEDNWHNNYINAPNDGKAWVTDDGQDRRVIRGGSWDSYRRNCRSALRFWYEENNRSLNTGFRVVYAP